MENILQIKNLSLGFNIELDFKEEFFFALNNINLSFEKGKIHCLAGESGCGKTVLISSILNLLPNNAKITQGEILFNGFDIKKQDVLGKSIFLIPQDPFVSLNPLYTIENQMLEVKAFEKKDKAYAIKKIKNALEEVKINNIDNVLKSYPHELSGGMKQRVIIAMALCNNSELILADEPTTALDVSVSNSILNILLELKNKGKTIILITHDLSIVSNYSDSATIMYLGNVVEKAPSDILFKNPLHPYTKALLKALPDKRGKKLQSIKGSVTPITKVINGCKFNPRCPYTMEKCKMQAPELMEVENNHFVSCFLYDC